MLRNSRVAYKVYLHYVNIIEITCTIVFPSQSQWHVIGIEKQLVYLSGAGPRFLSNHGYGIRDLPRQSFCDLREDLWFDIKMFVYQAILGRENHLLEIYANDICLTTGDCLRHRIGY